MKKGSISLDEYMAATKRLEKMLLEANDLLRSAYAIAQRNGEQTNWEAFRSQLKTALEAQHASGLTQRAGDVGVCTCKKPLCANNGKFNICVSCLRPQRA
mgnify:FL=1|jgi:hypothetical protein